MKNQIRVLRLPGHDIDIQPAPVRRDWMDKSPDRFAYRCLPLNIANAHGWQVMCPADFRVRLAPQGDGKQAKLEFDYADEAIKPAVSHFGLGMITFHIPALVRTPPDVALYVTGPANGLKPGISPLQAIVETDWLPFTFTMNWRITVAGPWIEFKKGEPICMFFPVRLDEIEGYGMEIGDLEDEPELKAEFDAYAASRSGFLQGLVTGDEETLKRKWERAYIAGDEDKSGARRTALKIAQPVRKT